MSPGYDDRIKSAETKHELKLAQNIYLSIDLLSAYPSGAKVFLTFAFSSFNWGDGGL